MSFKRSFFCKFLHLDELPIRLFQFFYISCEDYTRLRLIFLVNKIIPADAINPMALHYRNRISIQAHV